MAEENIVKWDDSTPSKPVSEMNKQLSGRCFLWNLTTSEHQTRSGQCYLRQAYALMFLMT